MPLFTDTIGPKGALLTVLVSVSAAREETLRREQQQVPTPVEARLKLDTGAARSLIKQDIIDALGVPSSGDMTARTPSSGPEGVSMDLYDVNLDAFGSGVNHPLGTLAVVGADFSKRKIDGLIGRDVLATAQLVYNGPERNYTLSF